MLPALVFAFSRLFKSAPRRISGQHATRFLLLFRGVSSAASLRSGCYPPRLFFLAALSRPPRHTQVCMLPSFVFAFSRLFEASATSLRCGCYPPAFALSRRLAPRRISGVHATRFCLCFLVAFQKLPRHPQVWMLPACLCFLAALGSAASSGLHATRFLRSLVASAPRHPQV